MKNTVEKKNFFINDQHPYAGLFSFREEDKKYFCGRDREIESLSKRIENNSLTVIFGKSGIGKTSLIRAGLIPWIRSNYYFPIYLRIDFDKKEKSPIIQVKEKIVLKLKELDPGVPQFEEKTLWEYFYHTQISGGIVTPLLIFDQFEEIFTKGKDNSDNINLFVTEIADLIENRVPVTVQERLKKEKKQLVYYNSESNLRLIFSLREDYLPQLETFYFCIPSIRYNRFRVSHMKGKDAIEAVEKPAKKIIKDSRVAEEIIKKIPGAKDADYKPFEPIDESWETKKIEPFLLSLFCYQVNLKRLNRKEPEISMKLIQGMSTEDLVHDFYEENIRHFENHVKIAIEELLLTEDGFRKLHEKDSLKSRGVTEEEIDDLVNLRIIRKEKRIGIDYVELIHDVLAPILKVSRDKRKEEERIKAVKESEQKKRKKRRIIAAVTTIILVILAGLIGINLSQQAKIAREQQRAEEEEQQKQREIQKRLAYEWAAYSIDVQEKDRELSFRLAELAYKKDKTNLVAHRALLSVFYERGFYRELFEDKKSDFSRTGSKKYDFFAAFSPDGKQILTVTSKKAILWNWNNKQVDKNRELPELQGDLEFRPNASFSPDDKYIVFCTKEDDRIVLGNLYTNESTILALEGGVYSAAFSPDRNRREILIASCDKKIRLFDLKGKLIRTFEGHPDHINTAAFSLDGRLIVSAGWDNTVRLWDPDGNQINTHTEDNPGVIIAASIAPDGDQVVFGCKDGRVHLWNIKDDKIGSLGKHEKTVTSVVFSSGGQYILTSSEDKTVRFLTLNNFLLFEFKAGDINDFVNCVSFSPDNKYILIAPAHGPAQLRPVAPGEIIKIVNERGNVRQLTEAERVTFNIRGPDMVNGIL